MLTGADQAPKLVFKAKGDRSLLDVEVLKEICEIDERYLRSYGGEYCPGISLGYYLGIRLMKSCSDITEDDVDNGRELMYHCAPYYVSGALNEDSCHCHGDGENDPCCDVPADCDSGIFNIFYYLTDRDFARDLADSDPDADVFPRYSILVATGVYYDRILDMYMDSLDSVASEDFETVKIVGIDIGDNKFDLFNEYLFEDIVYFALAIALILVIMCLYLKSLAITVATIFNVLFSFILAYFLYYVVCRFEYFPFLNVLSGLILIAIGADDVFIFVDVWQQEYRKIVDVGHNDQLTDCLYRTLRHALMSIFVTSLTTASAFFANVVSDITAIQCFGIFSGLAILSNFFLMVFWVPGVVIIIEKTNRYLCHGCCGNTESGSCCQKLATITSLPSKAFNRIFSEVLPVVVTKVWFIWLILSTVIGIAGVVLVFIKPKLDLPSSDDFQLFPSDHPLERYDLHLKYQFSFHDKYESGGEAIMVWGIKGIDNGNHFDPSDRGHTVYDTYFDLSTLEAQAWMLQFLSDLKNASFVTNNFRQAEFLLEWFYADELSFCTGRAIPDAYKDCCFQNGGPVSSYTFNKCFPIFARFAYDEGHYFWDKTVFDVDGTIKAYAIDLDTMQPFQTNYDVMEENYDTLDDFLKNAIKTAPEGLKGAWFAGWFDFYDLQRALSTGTYIAIGLSLGVALLVMIATSLNFLLSLYAIINIGFTISVTVGILVLLGWELNVLESVAISISVGLSIDFSIHYAVGYRLCKDPSPPARVQESLTRVGPAIAMAALTTFLAGAAIMGTRILAYIQLGTFLMLVMVVSWLFATFFFLPLCSVAGPKGNCAQITCPPCKQTEKPYVLENLK